MYNKKQVNEVTETCKGVLVDSDKLRNMVYFQKHYLPKDISLSMINAKVVYNYPQTYLDVVKDCYELALFYVKQNKSLREIERTVDRYFFYRVKASLQDDPRCWNFVMSKL